MMSYSIYRALSAHGIGEGPGKPAVGPDQYLWSSPELWRDQALLDALRPWMTLKFKAQHRFERHDFQEAWSCCIIRGFLFAIRLTLDASDRYFAHARAWKITDLTLGFDPGALICHSQAFDSASDTLGGSKSPDPRMTWVDLLQTHPEETARFVSHLYAARLTRRPMIVVSETYRSNDMFIRALAFARATLPLPLRRECPIRIYTRETTHFLRELKAGLVVVPSEALMGIIAAQPDVTLLTADGGSLHGPAVDETYGRMVVTRALNFPDALFAYADRCKPGLPVPIAKTVYNLAAASGKTDWMDDLLESVLYGSPISPDIVLPAEWKQFSPSVLQRLVLQLAGKGSVDGWRTRVLNEIHSRSLSLDPLLERWWAAQDSSSRGVALLELFDARVISSHAASACTRLLSGPEFVELGRKVTWSRVMQIAGESPLPETWAAELARLADPWPTLIGLMEVPQQTPAWADLTWMAFRELIWHDRLPSRGIIGTISRLPVPPKAPGKLLMAELCHRRTLPDAAQKLQIVVDIADREGRRWVVDQVGDPLYTCLNRFKVPDNWLADVRDLAKTKAPAKASATTPGSSVSPSLREFEARVTAKFKAAETATATGAAAPASPASTPSKAEQDNEAFMRRIVKLVKPGQVVTSSTQTVLDRWMVKDPKTTTGVLLEAGIWADWRCKSALTPYQLRVCAVNWMLDTAPAPTRAWTDWKQVITDLAHTEITGAEIDGWLQIKTPPWPWFAGYENQQTLDLWKVSSRDAKERITSLEQNRRSGVQPAPPKPEAVKVKPPAAAFRTVSDTAGAAAEPGRPKPVPAAPAKPPSAASFSFEAFVEHPEELAALAGQLPLWQDKTVQKRLAQWLLTKPTLTPKAAEVLNHSLPPVSLSPPLPGLVVPLKNLAEAHLSQGWVRIAEFLSPGISYKSLSETVLQAMANGESAAPSWDAMARETELQPHLLQGVAERIRKADKSTIDKLDRVGWKTLKSVVVKHPTLLLPAPDKNTVLPILEVACLVRNHDPAINVALDLVSLKDFPVLAMPEWWSALLLGLENLPRVSDRPHPKDSLTNALDELTVAARDLSPRARQALTQVLQEHRKTGVSPTPAAPKPAKPPKAAKPAEPPPPAAAAPQTPLPEEQKLTNEWIQALLVGDSDNPCWEELAQTLRTNPGQPHPWNTLAHAVRQCEPDVLVQLQTGGWDTLKAVLQAYPALMQVARTKGVPNAAEPYLPARAIAAELLPNKSRLIVAQDLVLLDTSAEYLRDEDWWKGLFRGLHPQAATSLVRVLEGKLRMNARAKEVMLRARGGETT
jgi:hypothetical protein